MFSRLFDELSEGQHSIVQFNQLFFFLPVTLHSAITFFGQENMLFCLKIWLKWFWNGLCVQSAFMVPSIGIKLHVIHLFENMHLHIQIQFPSQEKLNTIKECCLNSCTKIHEDSTAWKQKALSKFTSGHFIVVQQIVCQTRVSPAAVLPFIQCQWPEDSPQSNQGVPYLPPHGLTL